METLENQEIEAPLEAGNYPGRAHGRVRPGHAQAPSLVLRFRQARWRILLVALVVAAVTGLLRMAMPADYASTVVLLVGDATLPSRPGDPVKTPSSLMRLYYESTCTAVLDQLIKEFDLRSHYGIDENDAFAYARVTELLRNAIEPQYLDAQCLAVTVHDRDRDLALAMANALQEILQSMSRARHDAELERSVKLYTDVLERSVQRRRERDARLAALVELSESGGGRDPRYDIQRAADLLVAAEAQSLDAERELDIYVGAQRLELLEPISVVRTALPDIHHSKERSAWLVAISTFVLAAASLLASVALWHFHGPEFKRWMNSPGLLP
ncbi:MAG: hypothetical protein IPL52_15850 [Flavobacteriales bacterium]|nr:hypothetical protein [Flavobacteriales bacterium]